MQIMMIAKAVELGIFNSCCLCSVTVVEMNTGCKVWEGNKEFATMPQALQWIDRAFATNKRFKWISPINCTIHTKSGVGELSGICEDLKHKEMPQAEGIEALL